MGLALRAAMPMRAFDEAGVEDIAAYCSKKLHDFVKKKQMRDAAVSSPTPEDSGGDQRHQETGWATCPFYRRTTSTWPIFVWLACEKDGLVNNFFEI